MKGYIYTLEVLIAIPLIALTMIFIFGTPATQPDLGISIIKQQGFDAIEYLDNKGVLRELDSAELEQELRYLLPNNIQLSLSSDNLPDKTVLVVDYYIASYRDRYVGKQIRLWLWEEI